MTDNDSRRNARLLALMAANGFIIVQFALRHQAIVGVAKKSRAEAISAIVAAALPLVGMAASYAALTLKSRDKHADTLEMAALIPLLVMAIWYFGTLINNIFS